MTRDVRSLLKAVELLDETIDALARLKVSKRSEGSAWALSIRLRKARDLLESELAQPDPSWSSIVTVLMKVAKWLGEIVIDNIQYKLRPQLRGYEGIVFGTRACA